MKYGIQMVGRQQRAPEAQGQERAPTAALVTLRHVSKSYAPAGGAPVTVLDDVDLEVRDGEVLALLGQSGSGKSTIIRLMAGLTQPSGGAVLSHGVPLRGLNDRLAIVFQSFALYPWLTVEENVQVGLVKRRLDARGVRAETSRALELIGLTGYENAYPKQLSGGMRQRVGFARALVAQPEVLCMDEPFSALDVLTAENLRTQVVDLWRGAHSGLRSIFLVTHNIAEAVFIATRIVIISSHPGRIRTVIDNALPYPRDVNSREFAALVEQIHAAIAALALPDEATQAATAPASAANDGQPAMRLHETQAPVGGARIETIPNAPVETIAGLLEILQDSRESINVFDLSARINREFGDTIAIVKAAELLDLVDTPKHDVVMTETGWYFLAAPSTVRKTLFRRAIMKLRLVQMLSARLGAAVGNRVAVADVLADLATLLPYDQPAKVFQTLIGWSRYAELIDYDEDTGVVYLHEASESDEQ